MLPTEGLRPNAEGQEVRNEEKLMLPSSLDVDVKKRLELDSMMLFINSLDPKKVSPEQIEWFKNALPERYTSKWTTVEINYQLYGRETSDGLIAAGYNFHYYNFSHNLDMTDPEQASRVDICEADATITPHTHSLIYNPEENPNKGKKILGTLHSHPHFGFTSRKDRKSVESVGFSPPDIWLNNWHLKKYGKDGRKLAFLIYYPENDFYKGVSQTKSTEPKHLNIQLV